MKYKGMIFDFDYTLGDCTQAIAECVQFGLNSLGRPKAELEAVKKTIGLTLHECYKTLTGDEDEEHAAAFEEEFVKRADQVMVEGAALFEGSAEILAELKARGLQTGIVTTKADYRIKDIFEKYDILKYTDYIIGSNNVEIPKPDPEGLLAMVEKMGISKDEILYVGDSFIDAKAAMGAEMDFCGLLSGTTTEEVFADYPHTMILDNIQALYEKVKEQ